MSENTLQGLVEELAALNKKLNELIEAERVETEPILKALADISAQHGPGITEVNSLITLTKKAILSAMTEKTHKLDIATVTKRITQKLTVVDGNALYDSLRVMPGVLAKVKHTFTGCKIPDLVKAGALTLPQEVAVIEESESLVVKFND